MNRGSRNEGVADSEDIRTPSSQRGPGNDDMDKETAALLRIAALAEEFNHPTISDQARSAAERIAEGRFYVACLGQFKRGKSTLLNALVGEAILPAGVTPVTAVPTILRFGSDRRARVRQTNGDWREIAISEIEVYVSEAKNPENIREVAALEVFVPSALLRSGMCLVDTPGLGSVFAGNTAATHAFLPHIDAAIVVIGADPPIAGDELALVESLTKQIPDILFVLNKADRVSDGERSAAAAFCKSVLQEKLHHQVQTIYEVSALEQLNRQRPQRDWEQLLMRMENLAENSQRGLVHDASRRSLRRLSRQFTDVLNEERSALTRPIEESEKRLQQLREIVAQSEQSLSDLGFLLGGEQQRLSRTFGDRRNTFLESAEQTAHQQLALVIATLPRTLGPRYRRAVMDAAQNVARRQVLPWLESEAENAEDAYRQITKRFVHLANEFLARSRGLASADAGLPVELDEQRGLRERSEFRFHEFIELAQPASPLRHAADLALGAMRAHSVIAADAHEFLDRLLQTNSERVRNDLEHRVAESRRQLEAWICAVLRQLIQVAERALTRARTAHAEGAAAVNLSLQKLAAAAIELACLSEGSWEPVP